MSYFARDGENANSALLVGVNPEDFEGNHPLRGMYFQRELEEKEYIEGKGNIPVQRFADYVSNKKTEEFGEVIPNIKGRYSMANINNVFPDYINSHLLLQVP